MYQPPRESQRSRRKRASILGGDRFAVLLVFVALAVMPVACYAVLAPVGVETSSSAPPTGTTSRHPTTESATAAPMVSAPGTFDYEAARETGGVIPVPIEPIGDGDCAQPEGWLGPTSPCETLVD